MNYEEVPYIEVIVIVPFVMTILYLPILIIIYLVFILSAYILNDTTQKHIKEGDEFFSDSSNNFVNKTRDIAKKVIYGRNELPPKVQNILIEYEDAIIKWCDNRKN